MSRKAHPIRKPSVAASDQRRLRETPAVPSRFPTQHDPKRRYGAVVRPAQRATTHLRR